MNFNSFDNNFGQNYSGTYNSDIESNIPTHKKKVKYSFIKQEDQQDKFQENYSTKNQYNNFYQVCNFKNPTTRKYNLRKYVVNRKNEFVEVKDYLLNSKNFKRFLKTNKPHTVKRLNFDNLDRVDPPNYFDISTAKSDILDTNSSYTGYAPFQ